MKRALVIAGDAQRGRHLALRMRERGFAPALARCPRGAVAEARIRVPDVVIIDPPHDEPSGAGAAREVRRAAPRARLFVVTGDPCGSAAIRAVPVTPPEPVSAGQVPQVPRAPAPQPQRVDDSVTIGALEVHMASGRALLDGIDLDLTPREASLLRALVINYGTTLTRDAIGIAVWGRPLSPGSRGVDVLVRRLRRKVDERGGEFTYIQTDPGTGYRMQAAHRAIRAA